ncbi:MAG: cation diffusion facilitator family transporter [Acidobacteriota bacterium]|jgi:cobalt-zinc-cadmium efflux system protein
MHVHAPSHEHHDHGPDISGRSRGAERRGLRITLLLTAAILIAELVGGYVSNSLALLADAGHMLTDVLAIALAYFALGFATRPATTRKTYGWYRLEVLAALINGVTLVVMSLFIFWEAYQRLLEPPDVSTGTMLVVAVIGLVANAFGLFFLHGHGHSLNMRGAYLHVLGDLLSSVAVVAGGVFMAFTDIYIVDPILSLLIGLIIVAGAYRLLRESVDVLLEAIPPGMELEDIGVAIAHVDGVVGVHDLHVWSLTSGVPALSCHVEVRTATLDEMDLLLTRINALLRERFAITHTTIQMESEEYRRTAPIHWNLSGSDQVQ